jgi:hypothetical protein
MLTPLPMTARGLTMAVGWMWVPIEGNAPATYSAPTIMAPTSASATTTPSTIALAS